MATIKNRAKLPPRLRFEVFKRDGFACVYCGATPPASLTVDHVVPLAGGGTDDVSNLVTACAKCNAGKGAVPLDKSAQAHARAAALERAKEESELVAAYNTYRREQRTERAAAVKRLKKCWERNVWLGRWTLPAEMVRSIESFLSRLAEEDIVDAMEIASRRMPCPEVANPRDATANLLMVEERDRMFRYFCGVCHRVIRERANP